MLEELVQSMQHRNEPEMMQHCVQQSCHGAPAGCDLYGEEMIFTSYIVTLAIKEFLGLQIDDEVNTYRWLMEIPLP